jgi:peptidyl-prolyl cis-trans isomerase C
MKHIIINSWKSLVFALVAFAMFSGCKGKSDEAAKVGAEKAQAGEAAQNLPEGLTPEQAAKVVAKVGDREITVGDVTSQINRLSPYVRRRWSAPEKRREFLDKLIRVELLSQEAERLGLDKDPEIQRTTKQVMVRLLVKNDLEKGIFPAKVDENLIKQEYEKEHDKYFRPAQIRASHIVLKTKPEAEKLLADLKAHATDSRYFREAVAKHSMDKDTKDRGGDLGYFSKPQERREDEPAVPKAVAEAAWKLGGADQLSDEIVETDKGFHIVRVTNKREEMNRSFESVKRMIENRLLRDMRKEAMDKFIEGLRAKAKIEIFKDNLAKLKIEGGAPGDLAPGFRPPPEGEAPHTKHDGAQKPKPSAKAGDKG